MKKRPKFVRQKNGVTRIIRANYNGGLYSDEWAATREFVLKRDSYTCQKCFMHKRELQELGIPLQINHIRPKSRGGSDRPNNLLTLCFNCHKKEYRHSHMQREQLKLTPKKKKKTSAKWKYKRKF